MRRRSTDRGLAPSLVEAEHAVARSIAESDEPGEVYPRALAALGEALGWAAGSVWELSDRDDRPALACVESWRAGGQDVDAFEAASRRTRLGLGEGLPGRVVQAGEPAWVVDVAADDNFPRIEAARAAGLHAAFCFPITSASQVLGAIEFFAGDLREPDDGLLACTASLGSQIGQFVARRRAEEDVHASEQRKQAMLEAALDCIVTMDHRGRVVDFNPAAERTFGYTAEEARGREMGDLIVPPALREEHRRGLARYLETETGRVLDRRLELTAMRAGGDEFPVELTITRIHVPGPPLFTGFMRDITERVRAETELRASRARIVAAADAARVQIERDLHDGAQQRLVQIALSLRLARAEADQAPDGLGELLDEAIESLALATGELRELARGIHPAALTEGGLAAALPALVRRCPAPAVLVEVPAARAPAAVEAAAYFVVAEGLTNVARYATASSAEVSVTTTDRGLVVTVSDDGVGGADSTLGSGLSGLSDRVVALEGQLEVDSPAGRGTTLRAEIPCA